MTVGTQHTHDRAAEYCEHLLTARAPHEPALVEFFRPEPRRAGRPRRATLDRVLGPTP
jgi:hypothetical protein